MLKKMMLLAMSVAALVAFAVPAVANAQLLTKNAKALKAGTELTSTSSNFLIYTSGFITECPVTIKFEVTENAKSSSQMTSKEMTSPFCHPVFTAMGPTGTMSVHFLGIGTGTARTKFSVEEYNYGKCVYVNSAPATALTANHGSNAESFHLEGGVERDVESENVCTYNNLITGDFSLTALDGTPIKIA